MRSNLNTLGAAAGVTASVRHALPFFFALSSLLIGGCSNRPPEMAVSASVGTCENVREPFLVKLGDFQRQALERLIRGGKAVGVQITGCDVAIVEECSLPMTGYTYVPAGNVSDRTTEFHSIEAIGASLPLAFKFVAPQVELGAEVRRGLVVRFTAVGSYVSPAFDLSSIPRTVECARVTHLIKELSVGSYSLRESAAETRSLSVVALSGATSTDQAVLDKMGEREACVLAATAPPNCSAPLQAMLVPVTKTYCESESQCMVECDAGRGPACVTLATMQRRRGAPDEAILAPLTKACEGLREVAACEVGGSLLLRRNEFHRSESFFRRACDLKSGAACAALGLLIEARQLGFPRDVAAANAHFDRACSYGYEDVCGHVVRPTLFERTALELRVGVHGAFLTERGARNSPGPNAQGVWPLVGADVALGLRRRALFVGAYFSQLLEFGGTGPRADSLLAVESGAVAQLSVADLPRVGLSIGYRLTHYKFDDTLMVPGTVPNEAANLYFDGLVVGVQVGAGGYFGREWSAEHLSGGGGLTVGRVFGFHSSGYHTLGGAPAEMVNSGDGSAWFIQLGMDFGAAF